MIASVYVTPSSRVTAPTTSVFIEIESFGLMKKINLAFDGSLSVPNVFEIKVRLLAEPIS